MKPVSALFGTEPNITHVYGEGRRERIASLTALHPVTVDADNLDQQLGQLAEVEVIFGTWEFPVLSDSQLARLPRLRAVFYGAGSVQRFARPMLARGIAVHSAWQTNGLFVARMTLGLVLLACKSYFLNTRLCRQDPENKTAGPGIFDVTVAVLGAGAIGRALIELLRPFGLRVIVFDPFLSAEQAAALGVEKVSLSEAFARGLVVTNHLADKAETKGLITGELLGSVPAGGAFINTGRSGTVRHTELIEVMRERPDLTALLDVTEDATSAEKIGMRELPNITISSHIAGAINRERLGMGDAAIEQFEAWHAGRPAPGRVTPEMLAAMA